MGLGFSQTKKQSKASKQSKHSSNDPLMKLYNKEVEQCVQEAKQLYNIRMEAVAAEASTEAKASTSRTSRTRSKSRISSSNMRYIQEEAAREAAELERTISAERKRTHTRRVTNSKYSHSYLVGNKGR